MQGAQLCASAPHAHLPNPLPVGRGAWWLLNVKFNHLDTKYGSKAGVRNYRVMDSSRGVPRRKQEAHSGPVVHQASPPDPGRAKLSPAQLDQVEAKGTTGTGSVSCWRMTQESLQL